MSALGSKADMSANVKAGGKGAVLSKTRFFLALVVAPMVPLALFFLVITALLSNVARPGDIGRLAKGTLGIAPHSYIVCLSIGTLIAFVLAKLERRTTLNVLLYSCVSGALTGIVYDLLLYWPQTQEVISALPLSAGLGGIAGLLASGSFVCICGANFSVLPVRWRHVLSVLVLVDVAYIGWLGWQAIELRRFEETVSKTTDGMSQDEVIELLGEPNGDSMACSYYIKPPFGCSTTLNYYGPFGSSAVFFLDAGHRIIGAIKHART